MNEEPTKNLPDKRSFEERVFARFDGIDTRLDTVDLRLETLESRSYDTKPIWENALRAIMDTRKEVGAIKTDLGEVKNRVTVIEAAIGGLATDVGTLRTDVGTLKTDVATLKTDVGTLKTDVGTLKPDVADLKINFGRMTNEFVDIRRELRENVRHELSLILKFLIEDRQDIRDAEDRIRNLETKLA
jgi:chromosome segregation ATPase